MTPDFLAQAMGITVARAAPWAPLMVQACDYASLNSVNRLSAFLGQLGHESGRLRWLREIWGPSAQQLRYEPVTTLSKRLGNTQPGDGKRYAGHGPIQVTGRFNHARVRDRLRAKLGPNVPDFEEFPHLLATPLWGLLAAADYWVDRDLNRWADINDHHTLTRRINGGTNGLSDRLFLTSQARVACLLHGVFP